jgi:hypothetical protein
MLHFDWEHVFSFPWNLYKMKAQGGDPCAFKMYERPDDEVRWAAGDSPRLPGWNGVTRILMSTPKGTRTQRFVTVSGDAVHIYSNNEKVVLQIRTELLMI